MNVEFDKSFEKWLSKISDTGILRRIEEIIIQVESATAVSEVKAIKKLTGFKKYYRIKAGDYRIGLERINKKTIRFIIVANRKDIYKRFP